MGSGDMKPYEKNSKCIAIIPARGGSKRIPKKNIKDFLGIPIIAYSIRAAIESKLFEEVMVSTDDIDIMDIAQHYGAQVPFERSPKNSDDTATTSDVIAEVIQQYDSMGRRFQYVCCMYATSPFVTQKNLVNAYDLLIKTNADSVIPVVKFSYPVMRALKIQSDQKIEFMWPEHSLTRSQDLEPAYHDVGQFYWLNGKTFRTTKKIITANTYSIELSELESQDIDTEIDWIVSEEKFKFLKNKGML